MRSIVQNEGRIVPSRFLLVVVSLCLLVSSGCSTFDRDWDEFPDFGDDPVAGRWLGSWKSDTNGHEGELRCLIEPEPSSDGKSATQYRARFHAKYGSALSFGYTLGLELFEREDGIALRGEANLGWLAGGVYRYHGTVQGDEFRSAYTSARDKGTYQMERVAFGAPSKD